MLNTFNLAAKFLWREWRAGEWFIVFFSLVLAIAAITSIHFYTDRLTRGLDQQAAKFLGGNLALSSAYPIPSEWVNEAQKIGLNTAEVWSYPSVIAANNQMQLVNVQAVSNSYPLLGEKNKHIGPFDVWVEPRVLPLLSIHMNDFLEIGAAKFRINALLTPDTDTLNTGFAIAPRIMMRLDDVPATRTILPGSRVDYRLLMAGDDNALRQFRAWIGPRLNPSQRLLDIHQQQFATKDILSRTNNYIQLTLLVCLIMTGVAIALSVQQYLRRHYAHVALWRCLGAKQQQITQIYIYQLFVIAIIAGGLAITIGYIAQAIFVDLFRNFLQFTLPNAGISPILLGFVTSSLLLFAFAYPVVNELPRISPLYIWRNEVVSFYSRSRIYLGIALSGIFIFVYWFMDFSLLTLFILGSLVISVACFYAISLILLILIRFIYIKSEGAIRRGLSQVIQYSDSVCLQFIGFGLILTSLLVLLLVRTDLINKWQQSLPANTPNYFAINIAVTDIPLLKEFFIKNKITLEGMYPMVRGRLVALNGKPIFSAVPKSAVNNNALHRELNMSWMWQFPSDNKIVQGPAWTPVNQVKPSVSVENNLASDLQLQIGDELTFQIGDQKRSAIIANFRTLNWGSFHPNFFMIFTPGVFNEFAATYITSIHLKNNQTEILNQLIRQFPNITVIDVANLLQQMQDLLSKVISAIEYLFLYAALIGILIFVACLQASMDERRQTYTLLHILGANKTYIRKSLVVEFASLTFAILLTSFSMAYLIVTVLEKKIFNF